MVVGGTDTATERLIEAYHASNVTPYAGFGQCRHVHTWVRLQLTATMLGVAVPTTGEVACSTSLMHRSTDPDDPIWHALSYTCVGLWLALPQLCSAYTPAALKLCHGSCASGQSAAYEQAVVSDRFLSQWPNPSFHAP